MLKYKLASVEICKS